MDVGHLGARQADLVEPRHGSRLAPFAVTDVDRDPGADLPGQGVVPDRRLFGCELRTAKCQTHGHELVFGIEVLLPDSPDVVRVRDGAGDLPLRGATTVSEHRTSTRFHQAFDRRVGMLRRCQVVRPVQHRGHAGVHRIDHPQKVSEVRILRPEVSAEAGMEAGEVVGESPVTGHGTQDCLPGVPVGVDEAGHDDRVRGVDHLGIAGIDPLADGCDALAFDQHVPVVNYAEFVVDGQDGPAAKQRAFLGHLDLLFRFLDSGGPGSPPSLTQLYCFA